MEPYLVPIFSGGAFAATVLALRRIAYPAGTMASAPSPIYARRRNAVFARLGFWGVAVPLGISRYGDRPHAEIVFLLAAGGLVLQLVWDARHPAESSQAKRGRDETASR